MGLLVQGVTPQKLSLSLACGVVLGVFPVMGSTTLLCTLAAVVLGLNLTAVQAVNFCLYPAQLALIVPFIRAGEYLLRVGRTRLTLTQMTAIAHAGAGQAFHLLWRLAVAGIVAWIVFAPLALALLYPGFLVMTLRLARTLRETEVRRAMNSQPQSA